MTEISDGTPPRRVTYIKWGYVTLVSFLAGFLIIAEHIPDSWRWGDYRGVEADAWLSFWGTSLTVLGALVVAGWQLRKHEAAQRKADEEAFERERRLREASALEQLQGAYRRFANTFELDNASDGATKIEIPDTARKSFAIELQQCWETWRMYSGLPWRDTLTSTVLLQDSLDDLLSGNPKLGERMGRGGFYLHDAFLIPMFTLITNLVDAWGDPQERVESALNGWNEYMDSARGHFHDMPRFMYKSLPQMDGWDPPTSPKGE